MSKAFTNPHPQPFSQAWEKGAEGGMRVDLRWRQDASNLFDDQTTHSNGFESSR